MKTMRMLFVVCLLLCNAVINAQGDSIYNKTGNPESVYARFGLNLCNKGLGYSISGNFILKNLWGGCIRYNYNYVESRNLPPDYYDLVLFMPFFSNGLPQDNYTLLSFCIAKGYKFSSKYIRAGIEFGPSLVISNIANYIPVDNPMPFFGSNYEIERTKKNSAGISVRGKLESPFFKFMGLETALFLNINSINSFIGGELCLNLGLVRR